MDALSIASTHCALHNLKPVARKFKKNHYSKIDLYECAEGELFGHGNAQLPAPPMLMLDRIIDIQSNGGEYAKGYAIAELDVNESQWYFKHHFKNDPVMPGCLLVESMWQLIGFHMAWSGYKGLGRVLDSGRTRFLKSVSDETLTLKTEIHIRKVSIRNKTVCIANGAISDGQSIICQSDTIKVGLISPDQRR